MAKYPGLGPQSKERMGGTTPDHVLEELRKKQEADRKARQAALSKAQRLKVRLKERARKIKDWATRAAEVRRLKKHGVQAPWASLQIADKAAQAAHIDVDKFRDAFIAVMWRETGIPQRNVFGCDWGPQGGHPPWCGENCTQARVLAWWPIHRNQMNGTSWLQLTWYEKVERAQAMGGCWKPENSMRVGATDLAILVADRGWHDGIKGYNGDGPAAEEYANDVVNNKMPVVHRWRIGN